MYVPAWVDIPLIVATLEAQLPFIPVGKPVKTAPVTPVVVYVMGVIAVPLQSVWLLVVVPELIVKVGVPGVAVPYTTGRILKLGTEVQVVPSLETTERLLFVASWPKPKVSVAAATSTIK